MRPKLRSARIPQPQPQGVRPCLACSAGASRRRAAPTLLRPPCARVVPATITVNSLADLLNPPTGITTLRSAIQAANANPGDDTINLGVEGTYKITLPGAGEDANATGDFDILAAGGNLTIVNTSGGK